MKNPSPEEFGLTQRDIEHYLKQKELFDNEYKKHLATNEILSFFITWIISTIIVFVITLLVDPTIFKEKAWSLFVLPIGAFFFPGLFLIAISDGSYRFLDREKEIKARFFSADLEHRYQSYTKAVADYNHYLEQNNRNYWIQMNGFQFEKEVASLFRNYGYDATVTSATADGGVDIILKKIQIKIETLYTPNFYYNSS